MARKRGKGGKFVKKVPEEAIPEDVPYDIIDLEESIEDELTEEDISEITKEDLYIEQDEGLGEEMDLWNKLNDELIEEINGPQRTCKKCGNEYPLTREYFYRDKTKKTGYDSWCKNCIKAWWKDKRAEIKAR